MIKRAARHHKQLGTTSKPTPARCTRPQHSATGPSLWAYHIIRWFEYTSVHGCVCRHACTVAVRWGDNLPKSREGKLANPHRDHRQLNSNCNHCLGTTPLINPQQCFITSCQRNRFCCASPTCHRTRYQGTKHEAHNTPLKPPLLLPVYQKPRCLSYSSRPRTYKSTAVSCVGITMRAHTWKQQHILCDSQQHTPSAPCFAAQRNPATGSIYQTRMLKAITV